MSLLASLLGAITSGGSQEYFKGYIFVASDFPTLAEVQVGWQYTVAASVTDNDPTKTNTGQSFTEGNDISWNGTNWTASASDTLWDTDGTNVSPLNNSSGIKIPVLNTANGIVQTNSSGVFSSSTTLPDGTKGVTQTQGDGSTKLATTAYVDTGLSTKANDNAAMHLVGTETATGAKTFSLATTITGGLKDANVTTAINLGDGSNTAFSTTEKTIVGAVNELDASKADDDAVMHLAGTESVTGSKSFGSGSKLTMESGSSLAMNNLTASSLVGTSSDQELVTITAIPDGVTVTTQANSDDSDKPASTAFVKNVTVTPVVISDPAAGETLKYNGAEWINSSSDTTVGQGITFFLDKTIILASGASNAISIKTLSKTPQITTQEDISAVVNASSISTAAIAAYLYPESIGTTVINGGRWEGYYYAMQSGEYDSYLISNYFKIIQSGTYTITTSGSGTTRTATITGGVFESTDADSSVDKASYLQTDTGIYQITEYTSATEATITVPSAYVNESTAAFKIWRLLFTSVSSEKLNTELSPTVWFPIVEGQFSSNSTDNIGLILFAQTYHTGDVTITISTNGNDFASSFDSPMIYNHNDLNAVQGGDGNNRWHTDLDQYNAINGANTPSATNVFATMVDIAGASDIPQQQIYYWAEAGSSSGTGLYLNAALDTVYNAVSKAAALSPTSTNKFVAYCQDAKIETITTTLSIPSYVGVYAPNVTFAGAGTIQLGNNSYLICATCSCPITFAESGTAGNSYVKSEKILAPISAAASQGLNVVEALYIQYLDSTAITAHTGSTLNIIASKVIGEVLAADATSVVDLSGVDDCSTVAEGASIGEVYFPVNFYVNNRNNGKTAILDTTEASVNNENVYGSITTQGGIAAKKSIISNTAIKDAIFIVSFNKDGTPDLATGSTDVYSEGGVTYLQPGVKLDGSSGTTDLYYSGLDGNMFSMVGAVWFKWTALYSGSPALANVLFSNGTYETWNNLITIRHTTTGELVTDIYPSTGAGAIAVIDWGAFTPVQGTEYIIKLNIDLTNGANSIYINNVQLGSTNTATGTRVVAAEIMLGNTAREPANYVANSQIRELIIFNKIKTVTADDGDYSTNSFLTGNLNLDGSIYDATWKGNDIEFSYLQGAQATLTNPITGTGTISQVAEFTDTTEIGSTKSATSSADVSTYMLRDANGDTQINSLVENLKSRSTGGTLVLQASDPNTILFSGGGYLTVLLPNATTLKVNRTYLFINNSSVDLTLKDFANTTLVIMHPGEIRAIKCTNISTTAGVWLNYLLTNNNLGSLSSLTYSAAAFVKMTDDGVFSLDTNTYLTSLSGTSGQTAEFNGPESVTSVANATAATPSTYMKRDSNANTWVNNAIGNLNSFSDTTLALSVSSARIQYFTGSSTATVTLPDATTLTTGFPFIFVNAGTAAMLIKNYGATTIIGVAPGEKAEVVCAGIGTSAGTWAAGKTIDSYPKRTASPVTYSSNSNIAAADLWRGPLIVSGNYTLTFPTASDLITYLTLLNGGIVPTNWQWTQKIYFSAQNITVTLNTNTGVTILGPNPNGPYAGLNVTMPLTVYLTSSSAYSVIQEYGV